MMPTIQPAHAADVHWDALVAGAGPAGAMTAFLLARQGRRVLLCEKEDFPRHKPCGCCVNHVALETLRRHGLSKITASAPAIRHLVLRVGAKRLDTPLTETRAIARSDLDLSLVEAAIAQGAEFVPQCAARRATGGKVELDVGTATADVLIACDGLRGTLLDPASAVTTAPDSWIGVAGDGNSSGDVVEDGVIAMHVGQGGYVGVVRLANGHTHIAAAVASDACRQAGGVGNLVQRIVSQCGGHCDCSSIHWMGTPRLTRARRVFGGHRLLAAGDACAYVEPFSGEGIAWALQAAEALATWLPRDLRSWDDRLASQWTALHRKFFRQHLWVCRALRFALHRPWLASVLVDFGRMAPPAVQAILHHTDRPVVSRSRVAIEGMPT